MSGTDSGAMWRTTLSIDSYLARLHCERFLTEAHLASATSTKAKVEKVRVCCHRKDGESYRSLRKVGWRILGRSRDAVSIASCKAAGVRCARDIASPAFRALLPLADPSRSLGSEFWTPNFWVVATIARSSQRREAWPAQIRPISNVFIRSERKVDVAAWPLPHASREVVSRYTEFRAALKRLANAIPCSQRCCSSTALSMSDSTHPMTRQYRLCVPCTWLSHELSDKPSRRTMVGSDRSIDPGLSARIMRPVSSTSLKYSISLTAHGGPQPATN